MAFYERNAHRNAAVVAANRTVSDGAVANDTAIREVSIVGAESAIRKRKRPTRGVSQTSANDTRT